MLEISVAQRENDLLRWGEVGFRLRLSLECSKWGGQVRSKAFVTQW